MEASKTVKFIDERWRAKGGVVDQVAEYIRIPNQSPHYDPEWETNGFTDKAIKLLVDWVKLQNVGTPEVIKVPGRTPVIYLEVPASPEVKSTQTVLMYGHMDKQPPMTSAWAEGLHPYTPVIREDKLYGRGGADDGYSTFSAVTALLALKDQKIPHPRIIILIEASEESGSPDLPFYVDQLSARLGEISLIICLDSGCGNYEQFWLTTSLRGIAAGTLTVKILNEAIHSGNSGIVSSSLRIMRILLDRLEDSKTGKILLKDLYVDIPDRRVKQTEQAAQVLGKSFISEIAIVQGGKTVSEDLTELLLNKSWRPQLAVTGAEGLPEISKAGNVLRTHTTFKLSVRLPPTKEPEQAQKAIKDLLEKDPPYGAHVEWKGDQAATGWSSPLLDEWLEKSIDTASKSIFNGKGSVQIGEGGSIPFMGMLGRKFPKAQFVITGVLGPASNAHGPNEFLHIGMGVRVTSCVAHILADYGKQLQKH